MFEVGRKILDWKVVSWLLVIDWTVPYSIFILYFTVLHFGSKLPKATIHPVVTSILPSLQWPRIFRFHHVNLSAVEIDFQDSGGNQLKLLISSPLITQMSFLYNFVGHIKNKFILRFSFLGTTAWDNTPSFGAVPFQFITVLNCLPVFSGNSLTFWASKK